MFLAGDLDVSGPEEGCSCGLEVRLVVDVEDVFEVKDVVTSVALATVYHVVYWGFLRFVTTTEWRLAHKMACLGSSTTQEREASKKSIECRATASRSTRIR